MNLTNSKSNAAASCPQGHIAEARPVGGGLSPAPHLSLLTKPRGRNAPIPQLTTENIKQFVLEVDRGLPTRCWEWQRARLPEPSHYGVISKLKHGSHSVHRKSWELFYGPIPSGLGVLHKCDNPPCCNPEHLFLGTPLDNSQDRSAKGRTAFIEKMAAADVEAIRREFMGGGVTTGELATRLGVHHGTIKNALHGQTYQRVGGDVLKTCDSKFLSLASARRKLTADQVVELRRLRNEEGWSLLALADRYGVTIACVCRNAKGNRNTWAVTERASA